MTSQTQHLEPGAASASPTENMNVAASCLMTIATTLHKQVVHTGAGAAVCNDGSPYAYFVAPGSDSNKWIFFQMGGSYCWNKASCDARRRHDSSQMSSNGLAASLSINSGIISDDVNDNPYFAAWNKVQLPYCTSDAFSGTVEQASWDNAMSFLGSRVIPSVVEDLKTRHGLVDNASTTLIYSGASAGAVGLYPNMDRLSSQLLPASRVVGVVDSGWFMDSVPYQPSPGCAAAGDPLKCSVKENLVMGAAAWHPAVDADCAHAKASSPDTLWQCMMGHYLSPYLSTPLFVFEWQFDMAQLYHDGITSNPTTLPAAAVAYAQQSRANLTQTFVLAATKRGPRHLHFFSPSCYQHVVLNVKHADWVQVTANGTTLPDALNAFVRGEGQNATILLDDCTMPNCNPTCPPPQHIG
jgi:hypothetical protein